MTTPVLTLIWAMSENRVIGHNGGLPWHLPDELKHFKAKTIGSAVIMGRKTWESLPIQPLPKRQNIVVTRNRDYEASGAQIADSLDAAIDLVAGDTVFVIGGASLFAEAITRADRLELTVVHDECTGDTTMPEIDWDRWSLVGVEVHPADERHRSAFTYKTYELVR